MQALKRGSQGQDAASWSPRAPSASTRPSSATASWRPSRRSAAPCSPTPAARASASGSAPTWARRRATPSSPRSTATSQAANDGSAATLSFLDQPGDRDRAAPSRARSSSIPCTGRSRARTARPSASPRPSPEELPAKGFARGEEGSRLPPPTATRCRWRSSPTSERIQLLQPFPRWDGQGLRRASRAREDQGQDDHRPHLAGGHVAPRARPPRQDQRQHVPGRDQRVHGRGGQGHQPAHGREAQNLSKMARELKAEGLSLGGGGRRELRRGLEPRARRHVARATSGCKVVIVRSFARIHETNLKKQGILPLTFSKPADYDLVGPGDRLSVTRARPADSRHAGDRHPHQARRQDRFHPVPAYAHRRANRVVQGGLRLNALK